MKRSLSIALYLYFFIFAFLSFASAQTATIPQGVYQNSTTTITVNWAGFATAADHMYVNIWNGSTFVFGTNNVTGSIAYGASGTYTNSALSLTNGATYSVRVYSESAANAIYQSAFAIVTIDTMPPVAGTLTAAGGASFQSYTNLFNMAWTNWSDALSGINTYSVGIVDSTGKQIVAMSNYANTASSASFTGLTLTVGTKYYGVMTGQDTAGNVSAIIYSNGVTITPVDTDPPTGGTITNLGGGVVSGGFQSSTTTINSAWANWGDATSGMLVGSNTYRVGVIDSTGNQIVALTNYANTASSASFTALGLKSGSKYYVTFVATDAAGVSTSMIYSNVITVDTAGPAGNASITSAGGATVASPNSTTLYVNWANWGDALVGMAIGAATYQVGVLNYLTGAYVAPLTNYANTATSATFTGLSLSSQAKYYAQVTAYNAIGNATTIYLSPPVSGVISNGTGANVSFQTSTTSIQANWSGFSDLFSAIAQYQVAVGTKPGATDVVALRTYVNTASSANFTGLALTTGSTYYVTIVAADILGFTTTVTGSALTIASAPTITGFTASSTNGNAPLSVTFTSAITSTNSPVSAVTYNFGDGSTQSTAGVGSITHTYTTAGTFNATVTATNGAGTSAPMTATVVVSAAPSAPGGLTLTITPTSGTAPLAVTATFGPTGNSAYNLDFNGDGVYEYTSSTAGSTTFTYTTAGAYYVYYNVVNTSGLGATLIYATPIVVSLPPLATPPSFGSLPSVTTAQPVGLGTLVTFSATGIAGALATGTSIYYTWDFNGDGVPEIFNKVGGSGAADIETFSYTTPGTYTVTCTISDSAGNGPRLSASATTSVTVASPSPASISVYLTNPYTNGINYLKNATGSSTATLAVGAQPYTSVNFSTLNLQYSANSGITWTNATAVAGSLFYGEGSAIVGWDYTALAAATSTYQIRVQLTDTSGVVHNSTDAGQQGGIYVNLVTSQALANIGRSNIGGGTMEFTTISNTSATSAVTQGSGISISVGLPAGATTLAGAGIVYMDTFTSNPVSNNFTTGITGTLLDFCDISITNTTGTYAASLTKPATLTIGYTATGGYINGSIPESSLQVIHYNGALKIWETLPGQVIDTTAHTITAKATSFSPFALQGFFGATGGAGGGTVGGGGGSVVSSPQVSPASLGYSGGAGGFCGALGLDAIVLLCIAYGLKKFSRKMQSH